MPSLTDIANQVNNTLSQIQTNTSDTASTVGLVKGDTADIKAALNTLIATNQAGFANLASGLAVMIDEQKTTNVLLDHGRQQNDTIICWLTTIADVLCRLLHRADIHVELQRQIKDCLDNMRELLELVHGAEAVQVLKREEVRRRLSECCPPKETKPQPCYEPCHSPDYRPRKPGTPDYKPMKAEKRPD